MRLRISFALVVALGGSGSARAQSDRPLGLAEVLARVETASPDGMVIDAAQGVAHADVHDARLFPNPGVAFSVGRAEPIFSGAVQVHLPILGQRAAHIDAAEGGLTAVRRDASWRRLQLRHDAELAYWAVARADAAVAGAEAAAALTQKIADTAHERYQVGAGNRLDDRQAQLVAARALQDVVDRRQAAAAARLELGRLLGSPVDAQRPLRDALAQLRPVPTLDALLETARGQHAELRILAAQRDAAVARARAARADRRPIPTLELGLEVLDPSTCGGVQRCVGPRGGLSFDVPVFNLNGGAVERAEAERTLADAQTIATATRVEASVRTVHARLLAATARVHFFESQYVPNANEVEAMAREGFSEGRSGLLPLIEAERAVVDARLGLTDAQYDAQAAAADLEEASGAALAIE